MNEALVFEFPWRNTGTRYTDYRHERVGTFCINEEGDFDNCDEGQYCTVSEDIPIGADLNIGYEPDRMFQHLAVGNCPPWEKILKWICKTKDGHSVTENVDIISHRSVFMSIANAQTDKYSTNDWNLETCMYKGKTYIRFAHREPIRFPDEWRQINLHRGDQFHKMAIQNPPGIQATYTVVKGKIGDTRLLLSAEIDAEDSQGDFVEVKSAFKKSKLRPIDWVQSYLCGVKTLLYGYKTEKGILEAVSYKQLDEMVGEDGNQISESDANKMLGDLAAVLSWIRANIQEGNQDKKERGAKRN